MLRRMGADQLSAGYGRTASLRGRATSLALAIGINLLLLLALLTLNPPHMPKPPRGKAPILLDLAPAAEPAPVTTEADTAPEPKAKQRAAETTAEPVEAPPRPAPPPVPAEEERPLPFLVISREEFAAANIARFGNRAPAAAAGAQSASASRDSEQVGRAPNGEPLYHADWYRRPTRAQLSAYHPPGGPVEGWGMIACRTAPRYRVEDCVELADSPPGSRLAGAVRQAAWQFLVRPPRIGGKELVGTWVRIRIEYRAAEGT
jgi:hypothetical protein